MGRSTDISSAYDAKAVSPSDSSVLQVTRAIYIGTAGDLVVRMASGATVTFADAAAGYHPLQVDMVLSTGTAADDIVALY